MAEERNKSIDAVAKLTRLTQEGEIKWSSAPSNVVVNDEAQQIESIFTAYYKDKRLRIYKKRYKVEDPNPFLGPNPYFSITVGPQSRKYPYWASQIYLELVNEYGHAVWTFPEVSALRDLLTSVKYQVSGVKEFIDDLLTE